MRGPRRSPESSSSLPIRIAITLGDPAGIGPEVVLKALEAEMQKKRDNDSLSRKFLIVGPPKILSAAGERLKIDLDSIINHLSIEFIETSPIESSLLFGGRDDAKTGRAAHEALQQAAEMALKKQADAIVTAPLSKAALHMAGIHFSGNTEILAHAAGVSNFAMAFFSEEIRALLLTTHIALKDVPSALSEELILRKVRLADTFLRRDLGIEEPLLALAALNPHAGEEGAMGHEEETILIPALKRLRAEKVNIEGPFPADTLFTANRRERYHLFVCCYHDQGLIPVKMLAFETAVNVTLGLPFVRTSPDHGTAYDIAGKGVADPRSMMAAIDLAERIVINQARHLE